MNTVSPTMSRRGFTLVELVVSVGLFMVAITVTLLATVGTNSLIQRTDARSSISESARSTTDVLRRIAENAPVGTVVLHGYYNNPDAYAGVQVKKFSASQSSTTCEVVGRATGTTGSNGEETYALSTTGDTIAYWIYRVDSSLQCPDLSTAPVYQNRLTNVSTTVTDFRLQMNSYPCDAGANCTTKQQLRYSYTLELKSTQSGRASETRRSTTTVASSLPIGLINVGVPALNIATTNVPDGVVGQAYSKDILGEGGRTPYAWSHTGSLPTGLSLVADGTKYILQGTPTATGAATITVTLRDASNPQQVDIQELSFAVTAGGGGAVVITTNSLPDGSTGTAYSASLQASGGSSPYTWAIIAGSLPPGLTLNPSSGAISGTPSTAGTFNFTVRATDQVAQSDSKPLSITIGGIIVPPPPPPPPPGGEGEPGGGAGVGGLE